MLQIAKCIHALLQLEFWQSISPAVKHGDLIAYDLLTVSQTFPHSVWLDILSRPISSISAEALRYQSQHCLLFIDFPETFYSTETFSPSGVLFLSQHFSLVCLCKQAAWVQGITVDPNGNSSPSKNKAKVV